MYDVNGTYTERDKCIHSQLKSSAQVLILLERSAENIEIDYHLHIAVYNPTFYSSDKRVSKSVIL